MNRAVCYRWIGALFLIHNIEEASTLPSFLAEAGTIVPAFVMDRQPNFPVYPQFLLAVVLITCLSWIALFGLSRLRNKELADTLAASMQAAIGLNGIWHLSMVLLLKTYVPGSITGILVNLPFTAVACRHLLKPYGPAMKHWTSVAGLAIFWHGPVLWSVLGLSETIVA